MRIRVDLEAISAVSSQSAHGQNTMQDQLQTSLLRHHDSLADSLASIYQQVDQRIGTVEELLKTQSMQLEASQLQPDGPLLWATVLVHKTAAAACPSGHAIREAHGSRRCKLACQSA